MTEASSACRRVNDRLARAIELGIAYQQALGYPSARTYLMEQAVDKDVIQRVLLCPEKRRSDPVASVCGNTP